MPSTPITATTDPSTARPTLVNLTQRDRADLSLFAFPPAGMGPSFYLPWVTQLPPNIDLFTFHLPGRDNHPIHRSTTDPRLLVRQITELIPADDRKPFGFFGHSIGALLAYEITCQLRRNHCPTPALLAVSGLPAPHLDTLHANIVDTVFVGLAGRHDLMVFLPDTLDIDLRLKVRYYAPVVADSLLILHYQHSEQEPLDTVLALYAGESDAFVPIDALTAWNDLVTIPATPHLFPGDHVYLQEATPLVLPQLVNDLTAAARTVSQLPQMGFTPRDVP